MSLSGTLLGAMLLILWGFLLQVVQGEVTLLNETRSYTKQEILDSIPAEDKYTHNLIQCRPSDQDNLLAVYEVARDFKWGNKVRDQLVFPPDGEKKVRLGCVLVLDQFHDHTGGWAVIRDGGIGHRYVHIAFHSKNSRGFRFRVELFGH